MTRQPLCHVRILICRTWAIRSYAKFSVDSLHRLNDTWAPRRVIAEREFVSPMSFSLLLSTVTCALRRSNRLVQKMLSLNWRTSKTLLRYEWKIVSPHLRNPRQSWIVDSTWGELYVINAVSRN